MPQIKYIDNGRFYGKELKEQDLIILFQRPPHSNDSECETYVNELLVILKNSGDNLYSSDIVGKTSWDSDVLETMGNTLYIRKADKDFVPVGLKRIRGKVYDEIYVGKELAAKIQGTPSKAYLNKYVILAIILFCLLLIFGWLTFRERERISDNQIAYESDLKRVLGLDSIYELAISSDQYYTSYINPELSESIRKEVDSLHNLIDANYSNVNDEGSYSSLLYNDISIKERISEMVEDAKQKAEMNRISTNKKAYKKDVKTINALKEELHNSVNSLGRVISTYIPPSYIEHIEAILDSLKTSANKSLDEVSYSGEYKTVMNDSNSIRQEINKIVNDARKDYNNMLNEHRNSIHAISSTSSKIKDQRFISYVNSGDLDYKKYYREGDKAAALRAIGNYNKALEIKKDFEVIYRRNKLKKSIK